MKTTRATPTAKQTPSMRDKQNAAERRLDQAHADVHRALSRLAQAERLAMAAQMGATMQRK